MHSELNFSQLEELVPEFHPISRFQAAHKKVGHEGIWTHHACMCMYMYERLFKKRTELATQDESFFKKKAELATQDEVV